MVDRPPDRPWWSEADASAVPLFAKAGLSPGDYLECGESPISARKVGWFSPASPIPQPVAKRPLHFSTSSTPGRLLPGSVLCLKPRSMKQNALEENRSATQIQVDSNSGVQFVPDAHAIVMEDSGAVQQNQKLSSPPKPPSAAISSGSPVSEQAQCFLAALKPIRTSATSEISPLRMTPQAAAAGREAAPLAPTTLVNDQETSTHQRVTYSDKMSPLSLLFGTTPSYQEAQDLATMCLASPSFQLPFLQSPSKTKTSQVSGSDPCAVVRGSGGQNLETTGQSMAPHHRLASTSAVASEHFDSSKASSTRAAGLRMPSSCEPHLHTSGNIIKLPSLHEKVIRKLEQSEAPPGTPRGLFNRMFGENNSALKISESDHLYQSLLPPPAPLSLPIIPSSPSQTLPPQLTLRQWPADLDPRAGGALNVSGRLDEPIGSLVTASRLKAGGASGRGKRNRRQSSKLSSQETKQTSGEMEPRAGLGLPEESLHAMTETDTETETEDEAAPIKKQRQASKAGTGRPVRGNKTACLNCGSQQTPQWRCGPDGPRTLCNACGVRFKKGASLEYKSS